MPARTETGVAPAVADRFLNRELSWLDFNERVLALAADASVPLLERVKFCSIFASNLDEFFMVRVAGLMDQRESGLGVRSPDGRTPSAALAAIRERVAALVHKQSRLWSRELVPALAKAGVVIARVGECDADELASMQKRFEREVYPVLTPLAVGPGQPFPYISGLSLSLGVFVHDPETGEERFARVKVPQGLPRFLEIGSDGRRVPLEAVISHFLERLFPQMEVLECAVFRVTRDADYELSDEADDLLEAVEIELRRRRFGEAVRLEVSESMSSRMIERLRGALHVSDEEVYRVKGLLDLADLKELTALDRPELKDPPWFGATPAPFAESHTPTEIFGAVAARDVLAHHPYDAFATSFEAFLRAAAEDGDVTAIKTTVYRTDEDSPLVPALVEAAEAGKQSVCLVELKARFDERRNIEWSRALERSGVHVVYGFPNLKIHAKLTLVVRKEGNGVRRYVHLGTGNYHALTARLYEDFGLFTADPEIAADVAELFNYLTGFGRPQRFRKLLVAPFALRRRLIDEIRAVAQAAEAGKTARIRIKVNSFTDEALAEELYAASRAGAEIDVVARSICTLRPGVPGLSERIRVRSVLGRFLEHSRVFHFQAGKRSTWLLGSADLMPRNLDHRLEVVAPVEDALAQSRLASALDTLVRANESTWELGPDGTWKRLRPGSGEPTRAPQDVLMRNARRRLRSRTRPAARR